MTDTTVRNTHLRDMLREHRRDVQNEVRHRIRDGRADRPRAGDDLEHSDADSQGDLDLALLQMRAETVVRIDLALRRLDAGTYGRCAECLRDIAERRLRALPFAVRCQACEGKREEEHGHTQKLAQRRGSLSLFTDFVSS